jgi:hypothetical protein
VAGGTRPVRPRTLGDPKHFLGLEGSTLQEVKSATTEHIRPEALVGQAGGHDQARRKRHFVHLCQQRSPVAIGQSVFADYDSDFGVMADGFDSIPRRSGCA